ncbi:RHS repeat protein [Salmonella enterica]|uniref:RHS repeat protein n=1 Tax=Salmonella montevideo TaxID=115981 RepID=A0A624B873_SALMO|nr:RHS repeat protein [Salmonella enterica]EAW1963279.1 RHS repeat protein [Salmonella enterica subsp. enterica]ECZ5262981.1 RHS repeat protein [Salmonella enterica subsp. enterica serovar Montevideo]EDP9256970.1 RHS repeat protein [Salmonella enterica subsp. enterica serovar Newmexico]EDU6325050.1 RHS repeat protein [Salmonella enterica subsp. enterica serovar Edinburgh]EGI6214492.1 RHS repeat protein [Salmonella enterica subsp. enterica serovar Denver]EJU7759167.1 RHS repeat protein [Salmon
MSNTTTSLYYATPSVTVMDNRGLNIRHIEYCRQTPGETAQTYISRQVFDTAGHLSDSYDPRLYSASLTDSTVKPNFSYRYDLTGALIYTDSVDAGPSLLLNDAALRPLQHYNADNVRKRYEYESPETGRGRVTAVYEKKSASEERCLERFVYASNTSEAKARNLFGQCVRHYDPAGLLQTNDISLTGAPVSVTRRLIKDAASPDILADWQGKNADVWDSRLDSENHTTLYTVDATGAVLTTTDTRGNRQRVSYDISGQLSGSWLTIKDSPEQVIVKSLTHSAAGLKLREEHGNGVVTTYIYDPQTQRLVGIKAERPSGHTAGAKVLQDLRYEYDPVGNVLKICDQAEETRFWRNQKVVPENTYRYDTLYQLISATGREMASAGQQDSRSPSPTVPLPADSSAFTNYTRSYRYDLAGNLTQIRHSSPATSNNYTTEITVSGRSNRGVQSSLTTKPSEVDALFTAGGQQKQLQPGQSLSWTARNELLKVTPVVRDGGRDDRESYRYDAGSQRLLKVSEQKTAGSMQTQQVLYLPGIELRTTAAGGVIKEKLYVMTMGEAGRAQVRAQHWETGKPAEVSNNLVRYNYDSLTGSSGIELDGSGAVISMEEYYPYGGTAVWTARSVVEANYKTVRYSGKERDATGLYYYGYRYYQPWVGRWMSADPAGTVDGLNLFRMVRNNPVKYSDASGTEATEYNLYSSNNKNTVVYRVEPLVFSEKFTHIFIDNNNARVYYPQASASGKLPYRSAEGKNNPTYYETVQGKGYVNKLTAEEKKMQATGEPVNLKFIKSKITPSSKQGLSTYEYSRNYLANNSGHPLGTMGWLGFNSPERAYDFYQQKTANEGEKLTFVVKSFEIPSGVYKAIAETAITEHMRSTDLTAPINVDVVAAGQLGLQSHHLDLINKFAINGSARIYQGDDVNQLRSTTSYQSRTRIKHSPLRDSESTQKTRVKFRNLLN